MSVQATCWVWEHSQAEGTARLVILAIADAANREGERAWVSANTIAKMCRIGHRTAQRKVAELVAMGELEKMGGRGEKHANVYRLPGVTGPEPVRHSEPNRYATGDVAEGEPLRHSSDVRQNGAYAKWDHPLRQMGPTATPPMAYTPINPSKSKDLHPINSAPQKKAGERKPPMRNPSYSQIFEQFWDAYPRKENKPGAYEMWKAATKFTQPATIIKAANTYRDNPYREPRFTKAPSNWLSARGWEDGAPEEQRAPQDPAQKIPGWVARDQANQAFANAYLNQQQPTGGEHLDSNWIAGELA